MWSMYDTVESTVLFCLQKSTHYTIVGVTDHLRGCVDLLLHSSIRGSYRLPCVNMPYNSLLRKTLIKGPIARPPLCLLFVYECSSSVALVTLDV